VFLKSTLKERRLLAATRFALHPQPGARFLTVTPESLIIVKSPHNAGFNLLSFLSLLALPQQSLGRDSPTQS
jgi:hypothetical protein